MPQIARKGDTSDHGGGAINDAAVEPTVFVNGLPIAVNKGQGTGAATDQLFKPDPVVHPEGQGGVLSGPTEGSNTVFAGGYQVHRFHDDRGCGAETITASPNVWADEIPQIRISGATVQDQKPSLAAPKALKIPYDKVYLFTGKRRTDCNGASVAGECLDPLTLSTWNKDGFYIVKTSSKSKNFTDLGLGDFQFVGTSIPVEVEWPEGLEGFGVPDVDRANRGYWPSPECDFLNSMTRNGILFDGFPSFGQQNTFNISVVDKSAFSNKYGFSIDFTVGISSSLNDYHRRPTNPNMVLTVENESGSVSSGIEIVSMPAPPFIINSQFVCFTPPE